MSFQLLMPTDTLLSVFGKARLARLNLTGLVVQMPNGTLLRSFSTLVQD